jgi:hypothetical protein
MRQSWTQELTRLRAADPARNDTLNPPGEPARVLSDRITQVPIELHDSTRKRLPARKRLTPTRIATGLVAVTAVTVGILAAAVFWPGTTATPMAYGITAKPDGSVDVLLRWAEIDNLTQVRAELIAAGVPAVVLRESSSCTETVSPPDNLNIDATAMVVTRASDETGVIIKPSKVPPGAVVVFGVPPQGEGGLYIAVSVTAPTCLGGSQISGP